jgi:hypothetical protein
VEVDSLRGVIVIQMLILDMKLTRSISISSCALFPSSLPSQFNESEADPSTQDKSSEDVVIVDLEGIQKYMMIPNHFVRSVL